MNTLLIDRLAEIGFTVPPGFVDTLTPYEITRILNNAEITAEIAATRRACFARHVAHNHIARATRIENRDVRRARRLAS